MLLEAILGIIAISIVFCCCTFCCYLSYQFLVTEGKSETKPETEVWEAMHYYDPLPLSSSSPPDTIFKPTPYTFKLQNGNGIYAAPLSHSMPHAVINPAVLQYPPGHVLDRQRKIMINLGNTDAECAAKHGQWLQISCTFTTSPGVPPKSQSLAQPRKDEEPKSKKHTQRSIRRRSRSRSPSPAPRGTVNVWSTNAEFQPNHNFYHQQHNQRAYQHHHQHQPIPQHQPHQQMHFQKQFVQLTQEHYPVHQQSHQRYNMVYYPPPEEIILRESQQQHFQKSRRQQPDPEEQYEPFVAASSHATNVYTQGRHFQNSQMQLNNVEDYYNNQSKHQHRNSKTHKSRHKEVIT